MTTRIIIFILPLIISDICVLAHDYHVNISTDGPIVKGGTVNFLATLYDGNKVADTKTYKHFSWKDEADQYLQTTGTRSATDTWTVTYDAEKYIAGTHIVNVVVKNCFYNLTCDYCYEIASASNHFEIREPISNVNVTGNTNLRHGDLLSLLVDCQGSGNFEYCVHYEEGSYNVTGNENCYRYTSIDTCNFIIRRYLSGSKYTVVIIIINKVSKVVQPVEVNFSAKDGSN